MKRGTALLAALLAACQAPAQVTAFTSPGALCSRGQQQRRSALSSTSDAGRWVITVINSLSTPQHPWFSKCSAERRSVGNVWGREEWRFLLV